MFPFFLGERLSVRFRTQRPIGRFEKMAFTLRCVEEVTETRQDRGKTSSEVKCYQVWTDTIALEKPGALHGGEIPLSFELPQGSYATWLGEGSPRYWELAVTAETPGLDFGATFLLPVYARPGRP